MAKTVIDLTALPEKIASVKGNMFKVFNTIYTDFSEPIEEKKNENNTYTLRNIPDRKCTLMMPDGKQLAFYIKPTSLAAYPHYEIILETTQNPDALYLDKIHKSPELKGIDATNYAITIASTFGSQWLNIWDAAGIECTEDTNITVRTFPLSLYRILISAGNTSSSWYENVAKKGDSHQTIAKPNNLNSSNPA